MPNQARVEESFTYRYPTMVQSPHKPHEFPPSAPVAYPLFYRTYSRTVDGQRETWEQMCQRTISGLKELGDLTEDEAMLMTRMQREVIALPSGRWLWVGGTDWVKKPENFPGAFNCTSTNVIDWRAFGLMMDLAMQGCGTGAVLEDKYISQIPAIRNRLSVTIDGELGTLPPELRHDETEVIVTGNRVVIRVGDSRQGWADSYQFLLELSTDARLANLSHTVDVSIDLSSVRPSGERLKGFGGVSNPVRLTGLYGRCAAILNRAVGRKLTAVECCLLIDEAAAVVVAGNVRRCLPEDAMVHTDHGLVPIKDVQIGDMVQTPLGFRRVVNKFDQGVQDVYEVPCNHPVLPRATLKHRMAVVALDNKSGYGWKPVGDLEPGDLLLYTTFEAYDFSQGIGLNSSICVTGMPILCESIQTYDIEVEEAHCFYCDGYLTHNSAGIRQFDSFDELAAIAKDNLWQQGDDGEWRIDPERDALRMANHTRVFHKKPSLGECIAAVTKQFWSGEGAIQWAIEAKRRANVDLLDTPEKQQEYLVHCLEGTEAEYLSSLMDDGPGFVEELEHRTQRYGLNPCGHL